MHTVKIESSWKELLKNEFNALYFQQVSEQIRSEKANGSIIYPPGPLIFNAFNSCPFDKLKIVILGQDPYHGPGEAMGLCFSVPKGIHIPPSLLNIYKELKRSFGFEIPIHGDLSKWTREGVLLLNASLTCLLYTSDAADERSSVDLGGRRIIKKKNLRTCGWVYCKKKNR